MRTGHRDMVDPSNGVAGGLFPVSCPQRKPGSKNMEPGSYPIRNHGMKWKLFTNTFLKVYYVPDTLQGSRLVGERKDLHRNRLGYSKRSQGDCMSREEGVSHRAGKPRKALQRDDAWARSWKADLPESRWRSPQKEWWGEGPQRWALQTSLTELQSCQDFE